MHSDTWAKRSHPGTTSKAGALTPELPDLNHPAWSHTDSIIEHMKSYVLKKAYYTLAELGVYMTTTICWETGNMIPSDARNAAPGGATGVVSGSLGSVVTGMDTV